VNDIAALYQRKEKEHTNRHKNLFVCSLIDIDILIVRIDTHNLPLVGVGFFLNCSHHKKAKRTP